MKESGRTKAMNKTLYTTKDHLTTLFVDEEILITNCLNV